MLIVTREVTAGASCLPHSVRPSPWSICASTRRTPSSLQRSGSARGAAPRPRTQCDRAPGLEGSVPDSCAAPGSTRYVLVAGTIAECDRVGDREQDYSGRARRPGVDIHAVTERTASSSGTPPCCPAGWSTSPPPAPTALSRSVTVCGSRSWQTKADAGAGGTFRVPFERHLGRPLTTRQAAVNRAHARLRFPPKGPSPREQTGTPLCRK